MDRVNFTFKRGGHSRLVSPAQAKVLSRVGLGEVAMNRSMEDKLAVTKVVLPEVVDLPGQQDSGDGLDALSKEELHALAKSRGLSLHHMLGADKVRAALREAE